MTGDSLIDHRLLLVLTSYIHDAHEYFISTIMLALLERANLLFVCMRVYLPCIRSHDGNIHLVR